MPRTITSPTLAVLPRRASTVFSCNMNRWFAHRSWSGDWKCLKFKVCSVLPGICFSPHLELNRWPEEWRARAGVFAVTQIMMKKVRLWFNITDPAALLEPLQMCFTWLISLSLFYSLQMICDEKPCNLNCNYDSHVFLNTSVCVIPSYICTVPDARDRTPETDVNLHTPWFRNKNDMGWDHTKADIKSLACCRTVYRSLKSSALSLDWPQSLGDGWFVMPILKEQ